MGGVANTVKKAVANPVRSLANVATFGTYDLARKALPGVGDAIEGVGKRLVGNNGSVNADGSAGAFGISPEEIAADQAKINELGQGQYGATSKFIGEDSESRAAARAQLAKVLTDQAANSFRQTLPGTAEDYNAGHLLNSSGYGNEVARQQSNLASQIASRVGELGAQDIADTSAQRGAALTGLQGMQSSALGRGFSLADFTRQANVAKVIGAQMAPQVGNGKGATVAGLGAGATAGAGLGPGGAALGGILGAVLGNSGQKGK